MLAPFDSSLSICHLFQIFPVFQDSFFFLCFFVSNLPGFLKIASVLSAFSPPPLHSLWSFLWNYYNTNILCLSYGIYCKGIPCFIVLRFTGLCRYCIFYKLKVCGNPASSKSAGTIFPTVFARIVSLCHILVILVIFQTFSVLLYLLWWFVIFDVIMAKRLWLTESSDEG